MRLAASRTFWTAGRMRPMSTAMMAMTTNNSINVNAGRRRSMTRSPRGGRSGRCDEDGDVVSRKQTSEPGRTFGYSTSPVAPPTRPNRGFVTMFTLTPAWRWCSAFVGATLLALGACDSHTGPRLRDEGKSVDELQKMLADADPEVQARGAFGLSRHGADARPAAPALIEALKRPTPL